MATTSHDAQDCFLICKKSSHKPVTLLWPTGSGLQPSQIEYIYKYFCSNRLFALKDYLLFIDTEASGLPKNWKLPYTSRDNWPYVVQASWVIYDKEGKKIKEQNHYVNDNDFEISAAALRIHGLTKEFLRNNGKPRRQMLAILAKDLEDYEPLIVGHFIELDYHLLGADYCREAIDNPMQKLSTFCIMLASKHLQQHPQNKFLRLGDLYELLFKHPLLRQHNAMADAAAAADCFFELVNRNEIRSFSQPAIMPPTGKRSLSLPRWLTILLALFTVLLIIIYCE